MVKLPNRRALAVQGLDHASQPVYLLDRQRRIVFINPSGLRWLQCSAEQVLGQIVDYHATPVDGAPAWAGLCPPARSMAGEFGEGWVWIAPTGESVQVYRALFVPTDSSDDSLSALMVVVGPQAESDTISSLRPAKDADELHRQLLQYAPASFRVSPVVGPSCAMQLVRAQYAMAVEHADGVLLVGPKGSGRQTLARAIHEDHARGHSSRLLPLDCALLTPDLLSASIEAFARRCDGLGEDAIATLLLLDVDQLERDVQLELRSMLYQLRGRMRVLATAQTDILASSKFLPELAVALATLTIRLPALVDRVEDLPLLVQAFLERDNLGSDRQLDGLTPAAMERLLNHAWRGNLDELAELLQAARVATQSTVIDVQDLPDLVDLSAAADRFPPARTESIDLDNYLQEIERELVARALRAAQGNRAQAARLLGISRTRLLRRLDSLGLDS